MQIRSWKEQATEIWTMIQRISNYYGGDDKIWLKSYAVDVIKDNKDDLSKVMTCFKELDDQLT